MSRLAKRPIHVPSGVEVKLEKGLVKVKGPKGSLETKHPIDILLNLEGDSLHVAFNEKGESPYPFFGLFRSLINNSVIGVSTGFEKKLQLIGVGYRAALKGTILELQLGFSHPCNLELPEGISVNIEKSTLITVTGINKQVVGQFAADVRSLRPPEPYKGKGVRYVDEYVRKKAGKAAKGK